MRRRRFLQSSAVLLGGFALGACEDDSVGGTPPSAGADDGGPWTMADEGNRHLRTWMAFGASERIWGRKLLPQVQSNLALIARTIAQFEPVSMLVRSEELDMARKLAGSAVDLVPAKLDDAWIRDTGPVFVGSMPNSSGSARAAVDFNFNGWGGKQKHNQDSAVARFVADKAGATALRTDVVLEGGALEVDGEGTAIITESCVLNGNRNPGRSKAFVEAELGRLLGIRKVIWLPGAAGHDITDGHTDFYARFAGPGFVVAGMENDPDSFDYAVTRRHLDVLRDATDAKGRPLKIEVLEAPEQVREQFASDDFAAGYVNFYVCNGAVIAPEFGDPRADEAAKETLAALFPDREIVQIAIDAVAAGGGGIHCVTQQEPAG